MQVIGGKIEIAALEVDRPLITRANMLNILLVSEGGRRGIALFECRRVLYECYLSVHPLFLKKI